tara:strand:+ start:768 stop:1010 length:243 start_codon:yes stop_codon:yes gene_type:complete
MNTFKEKYTEISDSLRQKVRVKAMENVKNNLIKVGRTVSEIEEEKLIEMIALEEEELLKKYKRFGVTAGLFMFGISNIWG